MDPPTEKLQVIKMPAMEFLGGWGGKGGWGCGRNELGGKNKNGKEGGREKKKSGVEREGRGRKETRNNGTSFDS